MATKIFKGIGSLLGIGKKKAEPAAAPEVKKGPIITQLPGAPSTPTLLDARRRAARGSAAPSPTILADKLGSY